MPAAKPCPDGYLPVGLPPSLAREGRAGARSLPNFHSQMLTSADATEASLSAPADLGVSAVCIYWGGGTGRIWESLSQEAGHSRPALSSHIYPANCLPDTGSLVPLPDLQGPFHPVPPSACFLARPTAHPVSLPHGPSPIPLYSKLWNIYLQGYLPWPPRSPCVWSLSPYCVPCPILTTYITSYHQQPWGRQMPTPFYRWRN